MLNPGQMKIEGGGGEEEKLTLRGQARSQCESKKNSKKKKEKKSWRFKRSPAHLYLCILP